MKVIFAFLLFGSAVAFPPMPAGDPIPAIKGLVTRILGPSYVDKFIFEVIPGEHGYFDVFEVTTDFQQKKPILGGNNGVAPTPASKPDQKGVSK